MRIRILIVIGVLVAAIPMFADNTKIYARYENARQALLNGSVVEVTKAASELATAARIEKQDAIAQRAAALSAAKDITAAKNAFAALSDPMIAFRAKSSSERPIVVYCSMEKKTWLQPKGKIVNPYVAPSMRGCGEIKAQ